MKQIFTFLLLCISLCTNAQESQSMFHDGKSWVFLHLGNNGNFFRTVTVSGDTIIGDVECKKLHYYEQDGQKFDTGGGYEKEGKIYVANGSNKEFRLVMDFSLHKGDEFYGYEGRKCFVYSDDTIERLGIKRRRLTIASPFGGYWVEGIGCSCGYSEINPPQDGSLLNYYMYECYDNGELIFKMSDFTPSVPTDIDAIDTDRNTDGKIYNVNGTRVETLEKGRIYIQNGKKFVK